MFRKVAFGIIVCCFVCLLLLASVSLKQYGLEEEEEKMEIMNFTKENFEEEVLKSNKVVLIDFYADWCGPCQMMAPVFDSLAKEHEEVKFGRINIDEQEDLAIQYGVMSIPTFIAIKDGEVKDKVIGAVDKSTLEEMITTF